MSAFDCFVGLVIFDALVGNRDRHPENWAVLRDRRTLAPSFDHGASLGFNAAETQMANPMRYLSKAKARHFGPDKTLLEVAQIALGMGRARVAALWLRGMAAIDDYHIRQVVRANPASWMSSPRRTFVTELVSVNRGRLLT